jgi:hypothetical protein
MKSVFTWYNILVENNLIDLESDKEAESTEPDKENTDTPKEDK